MDERRLHGSDTHSPRPQYDISEEFGTPKDSDFFKKLDAITAEAPNAEIIIRVTMDNLVANVFQDRFKRFKMGGKDQLRRFIITGTPEEKARFGEKFPGADWE